MTFLRNKLLVAALGLGLIGFCDVECISCESQGDSEVTAPSPPSAPEQGPASSRPEMKFKGIEKCPDILKHNKVLVTKLKPFGVRLEVDERGHLAKAVVPDTTNISEVVSLLTPIAELRLMHFVVGPWLEGEDWSSKEFRLRYGKAVNQPSLRTTLLGEDYRRGVLEYVAKRLPNVSVSESPGAF